MGLSLGACLLAGGRQLKLELVTTSLALDFLGRTNLGQWLEVNTTLTAAGSGKALLKPLLPPKEEIYARAIVTFSTL